MRPDQQDLDDQAFWAFPGWRLLAYFGMLVVIQSCWFALIYVGSDQLTSMRTTRLRVHFDFEEQIPFVPSAVLAYSSIYLLFYSAPFVLRTEVELRRLAWKMATVTLLGAVGFLLLPAERDLPYPSDLGICESLFRFSDRVNLDYNQIPSLHVALSAVCVAAYSERGSKPIKLILWGWVVAIGIAALLTYQHHLLDVITGLVLGVGVWRWSASEAT
jgi:membrane-associated phospholipid phosphatase